MVKIGVVTNKDKDSGLLFTRMLIEYIHSKGGRYLISNELAADLGGLADCGMHEDQLFSEADYIICLGGDGTFLGVARKVYKTDKPIMGVNLGSLGFLTEVDTTEMGNAVERLILGDFEVESRMMLDTKIIREGKVIAEDVALNDVVVSRGELSRILHLNTYINDEYIDSIPGDGVIICSPTGSTAYSLSAGGPIVQPDLDMIITTPICPHSLSSRSVITSGDRIVRVMVGENYTHEAMVTVDGQEGYLIHGGDEIQIKKSRHTIKIIKGKKKNYFHVLRSKIYRRGESIRNHEI